LLSIGLPSIIALANSEISRIFTVALRARRPDSLFPNVRITV
jgi:hypothetical protein